MEWFEDIGSTVNDWFSDDVAGDNYESAGEDFMTGADPGSGTAFDNYSGSDILGEPEGTGTAWDQYDNEAVMDMADETWNVDWDNMFAYEAGDESDQSLLDQAMSFAGSKTGQGLIGGAIGQAGRSLGESSRRKWQEEQDKLAHQRRLEAISAGRSGGGRRTPAPGSADVTKSKLAANMVRR